MNKSISRTVETFTILILPDFYPAEVDATELRRVFDRDGVLVLPDFLSETDLIPLRRELDDHFSAIAPETLVAIEENGPKRNKFGCDVISWNPVGEGNALFKELADKANFAEVTEAVLDSGFTAPSSLVMYSVGGGRGQAWHQDCPSENAGFNLNRLFYTDNVSLEDGAIVFVPGSHRFGQIPPGGHQDLIEGEILLTPRAGTLVLLHGHVYHRVTPNLNMKPRVSVNFRAYPAGVPETVNCIGVYRNGSVNFCDKPKQHDGTPVAAEKQVGAMR